MNDEREQTFSQLLVEVDGSDKHHEVFALAANARAMPELVTPGINGYLFNAQDSDDAARRIDQLVAQRDQWPAMGQASRAIAEEHAHEKVVAEYVTWYGEQCQCSFSHQR